MEKTTIFLLLLTLSLQAETDYLKEVQNWVDRVYKQIYNVGCKHSSTPAKKFEEIKTKREINCAASASITYQQAGLIDKGKLVSHTAAVTKNIISHYDDSNLQHSLELSMKNHKKLKKGTCDLVKVMKKYPDMPSWLKKRELCIFKIAIYAFQQEGIGFTHVIIKITLIHQVISIL